MRLPVSLLLLFASQALADNAPLPVTDQKQLFIDNRFISESEGIELTLNQPQKLGRIVDQDDEYLRGHTASLLDVDGKFRLYIGSDSTDIYESEDGMKFIHTGHSVRGGIFTSVFHDTHEPEAARRWKIFWLQLSSPSNPETDGVYAGFSADGMAINPVGRVLPYYVDNPIIATWDARISKYVVYTRAIQLNNENQRRIIRLEMEDLLAPWPHTKTDSDHTFFQPQNTNVVLMADEQDDSYSDIYYNAFTPYPFAQDVGLMFTAQFRHMTKQRQPFVRPRVPDQWEDFGLLEIQLAISRDGVAWQRPSREPYFPTGLADEWDRWYAVMAPGIVRRGNYLYQYYNSSGRLHDSATLRAEYESTTDLGGIGALRHRLDGFISADADHTGGHITTPVITFTGGRLQLNIDTGAMGTARVEIRDANNSPITGYTLADCEEIGGNFIDQTVYWNGKADLAQIVGQPVRLHFKLTRAKLYAFQFVKE